MTWDSVVCGLCNPHSFLSFFRILGSRKPPNLLGGRNKRDRVCFASLGGPLNCRFPAMATGV